MLQRRKQGLDMVRNCVDQYRCYDANHGTDIDEIEQTIKNMIINLEEEALAAGTDRRKLVVLIDNFHDLTTTAQQAMGSDKMKYDYLAQRVSDMATRYDIPLITTAEFKKLNGFRRPGLDDIRESVKIKYEAKAILLCYSEVGVKGESAAVYFERQGVPTKQPVFEVSFKKNKMSGFKGRLFYEFYPEMALFEPADMQSSKKYNNLVYSNE
jgi:replicative DNA helicase